MKNLVRFTLSLFAALVLFLPSVAIAQTSVDAALRGCAAEIECAATMRGLGITGSAATAPGSSVVVPFARAGAPAAAKIITPVTQPAAAGSAIAAYFWDWGTPKAEEFAASPPGYPREFDGSPYGGVTIRVKIYNDYGSNTFYETTYAVHSYQTLTEYSSYWNVTFLKFNIRPCDWYSGINGTSSSYFDPSGSLFGHTMASFTLVGAGGCPQLQPTGDPIPQFYPDPARIPDMLPAPTPIYYPQLDPDGIPGTGDERYLPVTLPGSATEPSILVFPAGHPLGISDPSAAWGEAPLTLNPQVNPDGTPAEQPAPGTDTPPVDPKLDPQLSGEYSPSPAIAPAVFTKPNFISYGLSVFTTKFPLDIIGSFASPVAGSDECPVLTFWGESYEVCIIKAFFTAIKAPALVSFIIWCVVAL